MRRTARKGLRLLPEEQAQLEWLREDGYGATDSEVTRRAVREAFVRQSNARLAGVHISVRNCRAYVMRGTSLAANWDDLEEAAIDAVEAQGGNITMSAIYRCPDDLARRADWSRDGEYDAEPKMNDISELYDRYVGRDAPYAQVAAMTPAALAADIREMWQDSDPLPEHVDIDGLAADLIEYAQAQA